MEGKDDATESDSGGVRTTPVVCCLHTQHHDTPPEPTSSPYAVLRAQGLVSGASAPVVVTRHFEIIIID